jgi:2,3-bisphosphoglycerate-independent phosphoglycerate mutase
VKYAILIGDGMGDYPLDELGGKTVLEAADTPNMDRMAREGLLGTAQTIPDGMEAGSDVANMAILGYDPLKYHTGRGPLEAASMGVNLGPGELGFRLNLVTVEVMDDGRVFMRDHAGGHISTPDGHMLIRYLAEKLPMTDGQKLYPGVSYRHLLVWPGLAEGLPTIPPHDYRDQDVTDYLNNSDPAFKPVLDLIKASWPILKDHPYNVEKAKSGHYTANSIWPWGQGQSPAVSTFQERWGLTGAVVSAVDLIKGLGRYAGLTPLDIEGATGLVDTNYEGKVAAASQALNDGDFVLIHVEGPDEAGHQGDIQDKLRGIELFDQKVVGPMWDALREMGDYRLLVMCDHFTPIAVKTHTREPVPFAMYPWSEPSGRAYSEKEAAQAGLYLPLGHTLMNLFIGESR